MLLRNVGWCSLACCVVLLFHIPTYVLQDISSSYVVCFLGRSRLFLRDLYGSIINPKNGLSYFSSIKHGFTPLHFISFLKCLLYVLLYHIDRHVPQHLFDQGSHICMDYNAQTCRSSLCSSLFMITHWPSNCVGFILVDIITKCMWIFTHRQHKCLVK